MKIEFQDQLYLVTVSDLPPGSEIVSPTHNKSNNQKKKHFYLRHSTQEKTLLLNSGPVGLRHGAIR